jgi:hypothetical protein
VAGGIGSITRAVAFRKSIGVHVGDRELSVCQIATGPLGVVELSSRTEPYDPEDLPGTLDELVKPLLPKRRSLRTLVSIGLPPLRVFFAARPVQLTDKDAAAAVLLHDLLKSSNVNVDDMEVDLRRAQPGKKALAVIVASRRKYLAGLLSGFSNLGIRPHRTEPAPFALVRLAASRHKAPRKAKTLVRVFLGPTGGIAVLLAGDLPLAWRAFELPTGTEGPSVAGAVKALTIVARFRGEVGACDAVLLHGRPDLTETLADDHTRRVLGGTVKHYPDPAYDGNSVALGLALGALVGDEAFDLGRSLKPKASFWEIFPAGDVAVQAALLVCATLFLGSKAEGARHSHRIVVKETEKHAWMKKVDDAKLEKERKELEAKVAAIREYLDTRVRWEAYTRNASARLPEGLVLRSFAGVYELEGGKGKTKGKKSLALRLSAPIEGGRSIPRGVDRYLDALRRDPLLQHDFPAVELADLKWNQPMAKGADALAEFTVNCLPVDKPKAPPAGGGATKAKPVGN